jgi:exonuclease III
MLLKLTTLNTYQGKKIGLLKNYLADTKRDIWTFQEVLKGDQGFYSDLENSLGSGYTGRFTSAQEGKDTNAIFKSQKYDGNDNLKFGLAAFVEKSVFDEVIFNSTFIYLDKNQRGTVITKSGVPNNPRNIQAITLCKNENKFHIFSFHGLWNGEGKVDEKNEPFYRAEQTIKILSFMNSICKNGEPKVLCGDFNLVSSSDSFKKLVEGVGINLNASYKIRRTRSKLRPSNKDMEADYMLVSEEVKYINLSVPNWKDVSYSDHLPLTLEFEF